MFLLYKVAKTPPTCQFKLLRGTSLFGCNVGIVARYLAEMIGAEAAEPYNWHFNMAEALSRLELDADAFVIDLKPEQNASRYEILEVWGHSDHGWTPAMLKLRALLVDEKTTEYPQENFVLPRCENLDGVYTFLYFNGSVKDGKLTGTWLPPGRSSTNSALLWPEVLKHFVKQIGI